MRGEALALRLEPDALQRGLRALGERGFALLTRRWRALQRITASPSRIGDIAAAARMLTEQLNAPADAPLAPEQKIFATKLVVRTSTRSIQQADA